MAGPSGFVQRFKGRVAFPAGGIWIGGSQLTASSADLNTAAGFGTAQTSTSTSIALTAGGIKNLSPAALSGGTIYPLADPVLGRELILNYSTVNGSTVVWVKLSTTNLPFFAGIGSTGSTASFFGSGGSSISNVLKSTQGVTVRMVGISTSQWLVLGVSPSTVGALVFSTTT